MLVNDTHTAPDAHTCSHIDIYTQACIHSPNTPYNRGAVVVVLTCPKLSSRNVRLNTSLTVWDTRVRLNCLPGHSFQDGNLTQVVTCVDSGVWDKIPGDCDG